MNSNAVNRMKLSKDLEEILHFMVDVVSEILLNERDTKEWIRSSESNADDYFRYLVLRLMVLLCLICVNYGKHFDVLCALLNMPEISSQLPRAFRDAIFRKDCYFVDVLADTLGKVGNHLVVVGVGDNFTKFSCFDALFVNLRIESSKEDLMKQLFHEEQYTSNLHSEESRTMDVRFCHNIFWEGFDLLKFEHQGAGNEFSTISVGPKLKVEAEKSYKLLSAAMDFFPNNSFGNAKLWAEAYKLLKDLMELSSLLDVREEKLKGYTPEIRLILTRLLLARPSLEPFLNDILQKYTYEE